VAKWPSLPEGDLLEMLPADDRLSLPVRLLSQLADEGLLTREQRGDEPVLTLTESGQLWLKNHS
jgi:hypothetical protein